MSRFMQLLALVQVILIAFEATGSIHEATYNRSLRITTNSPSDNIMLEMKVKSRLSCAAKCAKLEGNCTHFSYNGKTGNCTSGHRTGTDNYGQISYKDRKSVNAPKVAHDPAWDDITFKWPSIKFPDIKLPYAEAEKHCRGINSHLLIFRTQFELYIKGLMLIAMCPASIWIGIDDTVKEGQLRYITDNTVLDSEVENKIKKTGGLKNSQDNDCCLAVPSQMTVNIVSCSTPNYFLCESA